MRKFFVVTFIALSTAFALLALPAHAQTATVTGKIEGQITNATKDAKPASVQNLTVRLFGIDANAAHPYSATVQSDASGKFSFANLNTNPGTKYIATIKYAGVDYFSDPVAFDSNKPTQSLNVTIYETTTEPSVLQAQMMQLIMDVQSREFKVVQIVVLKNSSDRTFIGAPNAGTLAIPVLVGAQNVQFQRQDDDQTTLRGNGVMTYTLPFVPGDDQIVFNYAAPFTPPNYQMNLKMGFDSAIVRLLVSDVGQNISSAQFSPSAPFQAQTGQKYQLNLAANVKAGSTLSASFTNLPASVVSPTRAANQNDLFAASFVLGISALASAALLIYAVIRQRPSP